MARRIKPEKRHHPYMNLAAANFFLPYAKERGVSKVARGESKSTVTKEGFMQAYARVKGDPKKLVTRMATPNQSWAVRRDNFVARHMAQMTLHGEKLWETSGKHKGWPTRRHLGLIMWAMTPDPTIVGRFIVSHEGSSAQRRVIKPRTNGLSKYRKAPRVSGKAIKVPEAWIDAVVSLTEEPIPAGVEYVDRPLWLSFVIDDVPEFLQINGWGAQLTVRVYPGRTIPHEDIGEAAGWYDHSQQMIGIAADGRALRGTARHELVHFVQFRGQDILRGKLRFLSPEELEQGKKPAVSRFGERLRADTLTLHTAGTPIEFEAYVASAAENLKVEIGAYYDRILRVGPLMPVDTPIHRAMLDPRERHDASKRLLQAVLDRMKFRFVDARTYKHFVKKVSTTAVDTFDAAERRFKRGEVTTQRDELTAVTRKGKSLPKSKTSAATAAAKKAAARQAARELLAERRAARAAATMPEPVTNPKWTTAKRDDPELWERVKAKVTRGTKGGKAGQWSARKAQFSVAEYQRLGGGYIGPKSPRNALAKWTHEEWGTKSGKASLKTGERYLPKAAREALTASEYAETTRAKRAGLRRGEQFTAQPERVARKTAKYRK